MIPKESLRTHTGETLIEHAVTSGISIETMKNRTRGMIGDEFPLGSWRGKGRIVGSGDTGIDLLVRGVRAHYTWDRITVTWRRLLRDHTLTVDELGGGSDAVGLVSLFAFIQAGAVDAVDEAGLLVLRKHDATPVHQYGRRSTPEA